MDVRPKNYTEESKKEFGTNPEFTSVFIVEKRHGKFIPCNDLFIDIKNFNRKHETISTTFLNGEGHTKQIIEQNNYLEDFCSLNNTLYANKHLLKCCTCQTNIVRSNDKVDSLEVSKVVQNQLVQKKSFHKIGSVVQLSSNVERAEKTTYCRPVINRYTKEFVNKTMEKNVRLQSLVKRLVLARENEKHDDAWNNYINELKIKHGHYNLNRDRVAPLLQENANLYLIDDYYYDMEYTSERTKFSDNIFNDVYSSFDGEEQNVSKSSSPQFPSNKNTNKYQNNTFCFPTASQGRLIMLNRKRNGNQITRQLQNNPTDKYFRGSTTRTIAERETKIPKSRNIRRKLSKLSKVAETSTQTEKNHLSKQKYSNIDLKTKYVRVSNNVEQIKENNKQPPQIGKEGCFVNIENKLDLLIQTINNFIAEFRGEKQSACQTCVGCTSGKMIEVSLVKSNNNTRSDTRHLLKKDFICGLSSTRHTSTNLHSPELVGKKKRNDSIDDILKEEMNKSGKVKKDIEEILTNADRQCAVQISFDIPTKDHSTEVTASLYETTNNHTENVDSIGEKRRMTIAVNTDPLGVLALLRVSTEAVKQILSYMPNIDYLSYLARLQLANSKSEASRFVCNICSASFEHPSLLTDHIQQHNLGQTRNCCVCRHVIDIQNYRSGLFPCQHCGQMFTRAYCRQLHEHACAKRAGETRDVTANMLVLS